MRWIALLVVVATITIGCGDGGEAATAVDPVTCHGFENGTIELTVTGGTTPYMFDWSNGETTEDLVDLGPGTYGVSIEDANGCTATASGAVTEPDTLGATSVDTDITCFQGSDGAIDLDATGGLAPYQFSWSNGATSEDISGLAAGTGQSITTDPYGNIYLTGYFTKTIEIKSDYPKGNLMLANTLLRKDEGLVKKMNDLPMSDSKNYAKYENERKTLFKTILPLVCLLFILIA